jgi:hypothetical protein
MVIKLTIIIDGIRNKYETEEISKRITTTSS